MIVVWNIKLFVGSCEILFMPSSCCLFNPNICFGLKQFSILGALVFFIFIV